MTAATAPSAPAPARDVLLEIEGFIARITLNRPEALNAYATDTLSALAAAFRSASEDDRVAVIVFTGAGSRAFCTGGDVKEYAARYTAKPRDYWKYMGRFRTYLESIVDSGKPVIARVNGMAVGGGNESHLACDLSVAAEHAVFRQVGTSVGSVACGGATQWLPLAIGDRRAREMLFLNEPVPARTALAWGLVNEVVPSVTRNGTFVGEASPEEIGRALRGEEGYAIDLSRLDQAVLRLAEKLYEKFPECARYTKEQVNYWKNLAWHQTVGHARDWLSLHFACAETHEGMRAFVEKRRADYRGLRERIAAGGNGEFPVGPPTASCAACGAAGLPAGFAFCGACGARISA